jgi:hypothetical protein
MGRRNEGALSNLSQGDGSDWISFHGRIDVDPGVTIGSFKVGREFSVKVQMIQHTCVPGLNPLRTTLFSQ